MTTPIRLPITAIGKPRATRRDKWNPSKAVKKYREWADKLRPLAAAHRLIIPDSGFAAVYAFPMPASWSRKKRDRMRGTPHRVKPDIDNCDKAILDVLRPGDDHKVWQLGARQKFWADEGSITITLLEP